MRRLPPLTAIEAFVQVARTGSIKAASQELALSPPALSRRIQALERFIGRPLFERRHQAVVLNADGDRLLQQIAPALDQLSDAVEVMTSNTDVLRLRLGLLPLWASQKLFPRLGELRTQHPELHLDIDTAAHLLSRLGEGLDAVIALARDIDPALYAKRLDRNQVYVIGARALIEGQNPITSPDQLAGLTALVHRDMPDTFSAWRAAAGLTDLEPLAIDHFDSGALMLEAAAQGLGIAFMHASHFEEARDDRIVRLFDIPVESPYSYWFACRPRALTQKPVRLFHDWLIATIADPGV
ncbi:MULTISPECIES: LysR substrate-binding domain-containing protein [Sphingomonas]|uniref:LysR family transcriptional regulator n=1 Tax=Sphingomonas glacialis TaxID=658225 RepID=A0ABQ3LRV1_9SPHN|nr:MULTISPECIES: LysR substrate-binding domain-containing protein [Sphingomonas]MDY7523965.1 LysR substrate-binding domain-containing protein [Sphingomonas sp. 10B4]MEB0282519.1 LysR substrate-binding domain-containing protein [Sphingomonas sp. 10B4]GHH19227.1 LysR family transcriptional regulator [Sphingomonas glacialis]